MPSFPTSGCGIACAFRHRSAACTLACPCTTQGAKRWGKPGPRCHLQPRQLPAGAETEPALKSQTPLKSRASSGPWSSASLALSGRRGVPGPDAAVLPCTAGPQPWLLLTCAVARVPGMSLSPLGGWIHLSITAARWGGAMSSDGDPLARGEIQPQIQAAKAPAVVQHNPAPGSRGQLSSAKQDGAQTWQVIKPPA